MNEDNDLNENLNSEEQNLEDGAQQREVEGAKTETMGEAVIGAAKTKTTKLFGKKTKKDVDDEQNAKITELTNDLQRTRADFENFRRQTEIQKEQYGNVVKFATINKILPLLDDMERAIAANPDTLKPLEKNLEKTIINLGLTKIESEPGAAFNPDLHDAVMVEGDGEEEVIAESLRTGYYYEGQVLRPTMVKVSKQ
jgi:molecular chaperone GrpE